MDRAEKLGLGAATAGHVVLFGLLSVGFLATPNPLKIERNPVDHLSLGYGVHGCAGQGLARLEAHAIIDALARRVDRLIVGDEIRVPHNATRSIDSLPVLEVVPA